MCVGAGLTRAEDDKLVLHIVRAGHCCESLFALPCVAACPRDALLREKRTRSDRYVCKDTRVMSFILLLLLRLSTAGSHDDSTRILQLI
jgi:hypothetical protein